MSDAKVKFTPGRRKFIRLSLAVVGGGLALGFGSVPILRPAKDKLRPPGAVNETQFLASCIKCGQCLQVCPPQVVMLDGLQNGFGVGTPYIVPREGACVLCAGLPCVLACPTGALDHALSEGKDAEMGLAVLSKPEICLAIKGEDCTICLDKCPIKGMGPIVFEPRKDSQGREYKEPVVQKTCVGCGVCEEKCPTSEPAITIVPRLRWKEGAA
ncbi:MAG: 4Fe-4S dicluster domain-containing protein [Deltaproteobacteria bacterium]|nr:4Fe-4S dicluster domain-containing protein [Deltaproteobacteria bacterium]